MKKFLRFFISKTLKDCEICVGVCLRAKRDYRLSIQFSVSFPLPEVPDRLRKRFSFASSDTMNREIRSYIV